MNSIKNETEAAQIAEFFFGLVVPVSRELERAGKTLFPAGADSSVVSYYIDRAPTPAGKQVFEIPPDDLGQALEQLWVSQGFPELLELAPASAHLAGELREKAEQDETVSPFIYVMF